MNIQFRKATHIDIPDIVRLLSDDPLGAEREQYADPLPRQYYWVRKDFCYLWHNKLYHLDL